MMHMTFYWGRKVTLLIDSWKTDSWTGYALTLLACFLFSLFYQYMEDRRVRFKVLATSKKPSSIPSIDTPLLHPRLAGSRWSNPARYAAATLFFVNSSIGYLLMLAVMSFNGGVFLAIVLGLSFGYLLFRIVEEEILAVENPCACA
ncbi:copper transporter 5.1-like [Macadamia integrifolia]|uniref:copper transporter 5.1-like n=1 Tax=Macadamia integrifolia TaxID=60698 RepID=UPI001C4FAF76|nr:copper transporter 5.1-like [Macadamia integrifolia]